MKIYIILCILGSIVCVPTFPKEIGVKDLIISFSIFNDPKRLTITTTRIDSDTIEQSYMDMSRIRRIRYKIELCVLDEDTFTRLSETIIKTWEEKNDIDFSKSKVDLFDTIVDWECWRYIGNEDGTIKGIAFGSYNTTCKQFIGGMAGEREVIDKLGNSYPGFGCLPISVLILDDQIPNHTHSLNECRISKHQRIDAIIRYNKFYSYQAFIDMVSGNMRNLHYIRAIRHSYQRLFFGSDLHELAEFLKLPQTFFKKSRTNEAIDKLFEALENLIKNDIFKGLLKIYLEEDGFYHRKILLNAKVGGGDDNLRQAKEELERYITERDERIKIYLSNHNSDHYQAALLFILTIFPHDMERKCYHGSIEILEKFDYGGYTIVEFGGYETYIDRSSKPTGAIVDFNLPAINMQGGEKQRRQEFKDTWQRVQKFNMLASSIIFILHFASNFYILSPLIISVMIIILIILIYSTIYCNIYEYYDSGSYGIPRTNIIMVYSAYNIRNPNKILMGDKLYICVISIGLLSAFWALVAKIPASLSIWFQIYALILFGIFSYYLMLDTY